MAKLLSNTTVYGNATINANITVIGNVIGGNVTTVGLITASGNILGNNISTAGTVTVASIAGNSISTAGNIAVSYFYGNGYYLTSVQAAASSSIANGTSNVNIASSSGNVTVAVSAAGIVSTFTPAGLSVVGNINVTQTVTSGNLSAIANVVAGNITTSGNVVAGNILGSIFGNVSTAGNVTAGNVLATTVSTVGNITAGTGNFFIGNGSQLTGISATTLQNGLSNLVIPTANANITMNVSGVGNIAVFTPVGISVTGNLLVNGSGGDISGANNIYGNAASMFGNVQASYIIAATAVYSSASMSATANITAGNMVALGGFYGVVASASGNITAGNIIDNGFLSVTGNATTGNLNTTLITATAVSTIGNITAGTNYFFIGNGSQLTGVTAVSAGFPVNAGTSSLTASLNGNINVSVGGTFNVVVFTTGGELVNGYVSAAGNVYANSLLGNVVSILGNITAANINANLFASTASASGNITSANINANLYATTASVSANISGGNLSLTGTSQAPSYSASGNITGGNIATGGGLSVAGSTTLNGNVIMAANVAIQGNLTVVGNVTFSNATVITTNDLNLELANNQSTQSGINGAGLYLGNAAGTPVVTWLFSSGNTQWQSNVGIGPTANSSLNLGTTSYYWNNIYVATVIGTTVSVVGNITSGNVSTGNIAGGNLSITGVANAVSHIGSVVSVTGNITAANINANLYAATVSTSGNITAGNVNSNVYGTTVSAAGNLYGVSVLATTISASGNVTATGNIGAGQYLLGNIWYATGYDDNYIFNGTSNIAIATSGGNATANIGGVSNVMVLASTGQYITGILSASGNIAAGNVLTAGLVSSAGNVTAGNILTGGLISAAANVTGGNILTGGNVSIGGNVISPLNVTGNIAAGNISTAGSASVGGNVTVASTISATSYIGSVVSVTGNITAANINANLYAATASVSANISGGNLSLTGTSQAPSYSASGNIVAGNLITGGNVSVGGNVSIAGLVTIASVAANVLSTAGNISVSYLYGNGAYITGITGGGGGGGVSNGATNISVPVASGNITFNIGGYSNTAVMSGGTITYQGGFATPKALGSGTTGNVSIGGNVNAVLVGPIVIAAGYNMNVTTGSTAYVYGALLNN